MEHYLLLGVLGFGLGAYGTLVGAGGGFILMPVLILLYPDVRPEVITSMSLCVVFANALSGTFAYGRMGRIDYRAGLMFAAATIPGAIAGSMATTYIPRREFNGVFGCLMVLVSLWLFISMKPKENSESASGKLKYEMVDREGRRYFLAYNPIVGILISIVVGFFSSLMGIGGGIFHVPALIHVLRFPAHIATATSQFVLGIMALAGAAVHFFNGSLVEMGWNTFALTAGVLAGGALLGAQIGARFSQKVSAVWIIRGLALALFIAGVRIAWMAL
jgi:hypothetical protein